MAFQCLKGPYKKDVGRLSSRACCDRARVMILPETEDTFMLELRKVLPTIRDTGAGCQRGGRCPIAGNIQGQIEWGSEQLDPVEAVTVYCREVEVDGFKRSLAT